MPAVGQIDSRYCDVKLSSLSRSTRIRFLSNVGFYPRGTVNEKDGFYHIDDQIGFIAVHTDEKRTHDYWSELTFFAFEEIRFLSAILLSMRPDHGVLHIYPGPAYVVPPISSPDDIHARVRSIAADLGERLALPSGGGRSYEFSQQQIDATLYEKLAAQIPICDELMLRGLSAILKADMLQTRREFGEEAISLLYVAMEVAFQLTLRILREEGISSPTALDAGDFLYRTFPHEIPGIRFFEDYYDDRIKTLHPKSRFGTFAFPPVLASDSYGLRGGLISMYQYLITREQWYTLWD